MNQNQDDLSLRLDKDDIEWDDSEAPESDTNAGMPLDLLDRFAEDPGTTDDGEAVQEGEVYFPPTDPVVTVDDHGQTQVLGGTGLSSEDPAPEPRPSAEDGLPGDEAITSAIMEELRLDASTTDLARAVHVRVQQGVAYLTGQVPGLEDAENVEAIAASVAGVEDVVEDLTVRELRR